MLRIVPPNQKYAKGFLFYTPKEWGINRDELQKIHSDVFKGAHPLKIEELNLFLLMESYMSISPEDLGNLVLKIFKEKEKKDVDKKSSS
ncbi:MAG: hypothetical protein WC435_00675 [Candidatus Paceibacterota bacterium]